MRKDPHTMSRERVAELVRHDEARDRVARGDYSGPVFIQIALAGFGVDTLAAARAVAPYETPAVNHRGQI